MRGAYFGLSGLVLAGWLLVPAPPPATPSPADARPYLWDRDELWSALEAEFSAARSAGCAATAERIDSGLAALAGDVEWLEAGNHPPGDERFDTLESNLFAVAPLVAACPGRVPDMISITGRLRSAMKRNSRHWDIGDEVARGGAPVSALIARGNDYPGNFSHVALLHVSEQLVAMARSEVEAPARP